MKVQIKNKGQSETIFTFHNAEIIKIYGDVLSLERGDTGKGNLLIGNYALDSVDFEITNDDE